ncbi:MAG: multi-sensor hybrid histidine kinase, partial [Candidatus Saccharibacteria bacterium]|nr:multi-sensor hybrid histidine kinase [Candidatus Saccharibacteria bacterium]
MPKAETTTGTDIEAKLIAAEQRYFDFIHNSLEGIWRFELDEPIPTSLPLSKQLKLVFKGAYLAEANDAMAKMYGLESADQIIGARLSDLMDKNAPQNIQYFKAFIASGYNLQGKESEEVDVNGNKKYFLNSLVGVIENDAVIRAWGTQLDVTPQHQTTEALKQSQERQIG